MWLTVFGFIKGISPLNWLRLGVVVALALGAWWLQHRIDAAGYERCRAEWTQAVTEAKAKRDAELEVSRIQGEVLAKRLIEQQQKTTALSKEYLTYANSITGNCPASLGVLVQSASTSSGVPGPAGKPADPSSADGAPGVAANLVGANIAENYTRFAECLAGFNALLDWHAGTEKAVK